MFIRDVDLSLPADVGGDETVTLWIVFITFFLFTAGFDAFVTDNAPLDFVTCLVTRFLLLNPAALLSDFFVIDFLSVFLSVVTLDFLAVTLCFCFSLFSTLEVAFVETGFVDCYKKITNVSKFLTILLTFQLLL